MTTGTHCLFQEDLPIAHVHFLDDLIQSLVELQDAHQAWSHLLMGGRHGQREVQEELDGGHDDGRVGVSQPIIQQVHDVIHLLLP